MTTTDTLTPTLLAALRTLAHDPRNPIRAGHVEAGTLAALRRRGLVGRVVEGRGKGQRTTSPLTPAGDLALRAAGFPVWSVTFRNLLGEDDGPAHFTRERSERTADDALAWARGWAESCGDCEVVEVEATSPLGAGMVQP